MNSPRLPVAWAEPAKASSAAESAPAASFRRRSEVSGELDTSRTNHRSAALEPSETARGRAAGVGLGRATAHRKVEHGAKHQPGAAHCESDGRDIAFLLGRVHVTAAARRAGVVRALSLEGVLVLHGHHPEGS